MYDSWSVAVVVANDRPCSVLMTRVSRSVVDSPAHARATFVMSLVLRSMAASEIIMCPAVPSPNPPSGLMTTFHGRPKSVVDHVPVYSVTSSSSMTATCRV